MNFKLKFFFNSITFFGLTTGFVLLFGFGCQTPNLESTNSPIVVPTVADETVEEEVDSAITFNAETFLPPNSTLISLIPLDLDGDSQSEYALLFKVKDAPVLNTTDDISYLRVYRFENNAWKTIKEDQRRESTAPGQLGQFDQAEAVRFAAADRDYLLVSKGSAFSGSEGYYLFGRVSEGVFDDLSIPKAYLNSGIYLEPGDEYLSLESVEPSSTGLIEHYGVACEERDANSHFGDSPTTGFCRYIQVFQLFSVNGFVAEPVVVKNVDS